MFAYGTTGSGKTYTMIGYDENPGISVITINGIFDHILYNDERKYEFKVSYVEIYNEVIRDLLVTNSKETVLELWEDPMKGFQLAGVTEYKVEDTR